MNSLKFAIFGLACFSAGGAAGYLIAKKRLEGQYQEDVMATKDFYMSKLEELGVMFGDDSEYVALDEDVDEEDLAVYNGLAPDPDVVSSAKKLLGKNTAVEGVKMMKKEGKGRPIMNYSNPPMSRTVPKNEDVITSEEYDMMFGDTDDDPDLYTPSLDPEYMAKIEAEADEFARRMAEARANGEPYVVDEDDYENPPDGYDQTELFYYVGDRVLTEDNDLVIETDTMEEVVGFDYEDVLSMYSTAYVRNDTLMTIYEIHRINGKYSEMVEGAIETPEERESRHRSRLNN